MERRTHQEVKYQPCGPVQTLSRRPKLPPATPNPEKHFSKISPGEFSKTAAMQRGCCFCDPPLYLLESKVVSLSKRLLGVKTYRVAKAEPKIKPSDLSEKGC
jgi:hypothetical protein